jgi:hypothetical protein
MLEPFEEEFKSQEDAKFQMYGNELYHGPIDIVNFE